MLRENEHAISFFPGSVNKGQVTLGKIVVHDRLKVEAEVLPRYFNHSSFASLRRQLNYFSFTRLGKGRQRGATYCNGAVIEMDDILLLKRRSTVGSSSTNTDTASATTPDTTGNCKRGRSVSVSSLSSDNTADKHQHRQRPSKKSRLLKNERDGDVIIVSPGLSPGYSFNSGEEPQITLDLTVPSTKSSPTKYRSVSPSSSTGDDEILAGCKALLSFAKGLGISSLSN
jgi:hypothetical protein